MNRELPVISVSQVNQYIKQMMDRDDVLNGLFIQGEISNYKCYPSGHHYFTLKDSEGAIRCVMFKRDAASLRFRPENGMRVVAAGRVTVFPRDGQYQLYCSRLLADGVGDLHVAFEQLKEKLLREGLFAPEHKKQLPRFPKKIALITSGSGAAVRDMIRILGARWPMAEVLLIPVRVQGVEAPSEISAAIALANRCGLAELLIVGRGGGSAEDLWAFNDERVARAIFASEIPVISAVGHEPDVTISDYVADLRAATPSNAAELAVPDQNELYDALFQLKKRMVKSLQHGLAFQKARFDRLERAKVFTKPEAAIQDRRLVLDYQSRRLSHGMEYALSRERERFGRIAAKLDALSPFKVLGRGFAIPQSPEGKIITSVKELSVGDRLTLSMADGSVDCIVEESRDQIGRKKVEF